MKIADEKGYLTDLQAQERAAGNVPALPPHVLPRLQKYVKVKKIIDGWSVELAVGNQFFTVNPYPMVSKATATWVANMLVVALTRLVVESVIGAEGKKRR